ncbi:MAG: beta-lactamase family protein [Myxococcales bacterium]|nr:beta-lactamase family protein [Myxococcales bacterium]MDH5306689.1 beta-lactamase family protein [Myxococcales bacterium]MDH5565548.1 beta-lactamase family protein [Myxococcales bacterium]
MDEAVLQRLDAEFASGKHGYIDSMLVIRNSRVLYEKFYQQDYDAAFQAQEDRRRGPYNYYDPDWHPYYRRGGLHTMQSVSKSVMATLIGIAIGEGKIRGPDAKVAAYFDDYAAADQDPRRAAMTLDDLLTMRSGIRWDEETYDYTDSRNSAAAMEASQNWTGYVLSLPMAADPGSTFVYSSGVTMLLDHILHRATGQHALAYAEKRLFAPLGIRAYYWKQTPAGETDAEGGLYLRARDLAKIGLLYSRDGVWDGRRILPEGWVAAATRPRVVPGPDAGGWRYGYQWWLVPYAGGAQQYAWAGVGYGGQRLLVVPEYDLIAVVTGWNIFGTPALSADYALKVLIESIRTEP